MRFNFFTLFMVVLIYGCHSLPKVYELIDGETSIHSEDNCNELFEEIKMKWGVYNSESNNLTCYYYHKDLFEKIMDNKKCFYGLSISELHNMLGEPSKFGDINSFYSVSKECHIENKHMRDDYHLIFITSDTIQEVVFRFAPKLN